MRHQEEKDKMNHKKNVSIITMTEIILGEKKVSLNASVHLKQEHKDDENTGDGAGAECRRVLRQSDDSDCGLS